MPLLSVQKEQIIYFKGCHNKIHTWRPRNKVVSLNPRAISKGKRYIDTHFLVPLLYTYPCGWQFCNFVKKAGAKYVHLRERMPHVAFSHGGTKVYVT